MKSENSTPHPNPLPQGEREVQKDQEILCQSNSNRLNNSNLNRFDFYRKFTLIVIALIYAIFCVRMIDLNYLDFGDGNYLYISKRVSEGIVLYKEILSPQPPNHLMVGALLMKLGNTMGDLLIPVRIYSIFLHLLTMGFVVVIANQICKIKTIGFLAGIIYLMLPIGFWWSQGYQSETLEIIFLLLSFYFILLDKKWSYIFSGITISLAVFTNMTTLSYLVLHIIYILLLKRKNFLTFFLSTLGVIIIYGVIFSLYSGQTFWINIWANQVGTYPKDHFLSYAWSKIYNEGLDIHTLEGVFILICIAGLLRYLKHEKFSEKSYVIWYALFSMGSILFVTKGGTVDYIFFLAEPMVAVFGAYFIYHFLSEITGKTPTGEVQNPWMNFTKYFLLLLLFITLFVRSISWMELTYHGKTFEYPAEKVKEVIQLIQTHSNPGDRILSPPFYAFLSDRNIPYESSESYIWHIKWINSVRDNQYDPDVENFIKTITQSLLQKEVKIVLLNRYQYGAIPPIKNAIDQVYLKTGQVIESRNETLDIYLPKPDLP